METLYKKVVIRSEDDLPKKGKYDTMFKTGKFYNQFTYDPLKNKKYWIDTVDWYLSPLPDKRDELIEKYRELVKLMTNPDAVRNMAYIKKELALMNEIESFENNLNQER